MSAQVVQLMAKEKGWWPWRRRAELRRARVFLDTFEAPPEPLPPASQQEDVQPSDSAPQQKV